MNWLSGGEGTSSIRRQIDSITITRLQAETNMVESQQETGSNYERWLTERFDASVHVATLQLLRADQYYGVLDREIIKCIGGESKPADALKTVAASWGRLNKQVGVEKQTRAWRRSQGMGA